jgi:hypothetical protein
MKPDNSKATILVISTGFLLLYIIFSWKWALYTSLGVGIISIASSYISQKIEWLWFKLSKILGYIIPNILLSIVFYVFLFPISLLSKIFNKDPLMLSGKYKSYFIDIHKKTDKKSFEKIW